MFNSNKELLSSKNYEFETPAKPKLKLTHEPLTRAQSNDKINMNSIQNSNTSITMFKKKRYHKRIKKSTLKLLHIQSQILQSFKKSLNDSYSDSLNQSYKQQLDKIFVIVAKIASIQNDKKYFILHCCDQGQNDFKFYFNKTLGNDTQTKLFNHFQKPSKTKNITNIDELEFQSIYGQGVPYFKFFVILREIPMFDKLDGEVLPNEERINKQKQEGNEDSMRKKFLSHVVGTQFRGYIEHFQKIQNYNYLTWHNMHVCFEQISQQYMGIQKEKDIEI